MAFEDFNPADWYWIVAGDTSRAWSSAQGRYVTAIPFDRATRIVSEAELCDVLRGYGLPGPAPTDADVTAEYRRRLFEILGADDMAHAGFIRADDTSELHALRSIETPTAEQTARRVELEARDAAVLALIDRYNAIPSPPPVDFRSDEYWT